MPPPNQPWWIDVTLPPYGAVADANGRGGGTPNADAIERAIEALGPDAGGVVAFPAGKYRLERTVVIRRHVTLTGFAGPRIVHPLVTLYADPGVTALRVECDGLSGEGHSGGACTSIVGLSIRSAGRNQSTQIGSYSPQIVDTVLPGVTASTTKGSSRVDITGPVTGFYVGMNVSIGAAFPGEGIRPNAPVVKAIHDTGRERWLVLYGAAMESVTRAQVVSHEVLVTLRSPGDFRVGDLIAIPGAGVQSMVLNERALCTVEKGSGTVHVTGAPDGIPVTVGSYVRPGVNTHKAFPVPTRVVAVTASTMNMEHEAAEAITVDAPMADRVLVFHRHLLAHVLAVRPARSGKPDETELVIDSRLGQTAMTDVPIEHAEAAIDMSATAYIEDCVLGGSASDGAFQGPAIAILGGGKSYSPQKFADQWSVKNTWCVGCRNAIVAHGEDAQAGHAENVWSSQARDWSFDDATQAGNTWTGLFSDGGHAYLSADAVGARFFGCYAEGGTVSSLGFRTITVGGSMLYEAGGNHWADGGFNRAFFGVPRYHRYQTTFDPDQWLIHFKDSAAGTSESAPGMHLKKSGKGDGIGPPGWFLLRHEVGFRSYPIAWADHDAKGYLPGTMWLPRGFLLGDNPNKWLDPADAQCRRFESAQGHGVHGAITTGPSAGAADEAWQVGDTVRDTTTQDGYAFRQAIRAGKSAPVWQPGTSYREQSIVQPTFDKDCGYLYQNRGAAFTSGPDEPSWAAHESVPDGKGVWTRIGAAAYFQGAAAVGGYARLALGVEPVVHLGGATVAFLSESIECTGTSRATVDLILPAGRYKRWIWNRTDAATFRVRCEKGSSAVTIGRGSGAWVVCNGTGMLRMTPDVIPDG